MSSETLYIEAQEDTPMVKHEMEGSSNVITIAGVSMPENTLDFYLPLLQQIDLVCTGAKKNKLVFHLDYMNSMSNKQVLKLISSTFKNDPELKVIWKYSNGDQLIKMKGEEMRSILDGVDFSIEEVVTL
ncbi:MAG: SiaC family regulatory phosphoprotein [Bacteroidota bacterium]|nr:SiaC family regulatory phosphoprotein [Bacteroidota bacterium]